MEQGCYYGDETTGYGRHGMADALAATRPFLINVLKSVKK